MIWSGLGFVVLALDFDVEDSAVWRAQVQNRRGPFQLMSMKEDTFARFSQRCFNGMAPHQCGIEFMCKTDRDVVSYFELHGQDGGNALLHQALRRSGKEILARTACSFAGIQQGQSECLLIVQKLSQELSAHKPSLPVIVFHDQAALARVPVKAAMANEVKNVIAFAAEAILQLRERGLLQAIQGNVLLIFEQSEGLLEFDPFLRDGKLRIILRVRDHHQYFNRRLYGQRANAQGQIEIANEGSSFRKAEKVV